MSKSGVKPSGATLPAAAMTEAERDRTLTSHLGLVHHMARQIARRLTAEVEVDELVSAGTMGLINALDSFDPSRGHAFSTYAAPRIRGAILDELRRQDHVPRSIRRKIREMTEARETLVGTDGNQPTEQELADQLGIDLATFWRWQAEVEGSFLLPIDQPARDDERRGSSPAETITGVTGDIIENEINHKQEVEVLRAAILELDERERIVLSLYYYDELKLGEIGAVLELTESRISQIHSRTLAKLRTQISGLREAA